MAEIRSINATITGLAASDYSRQARKRPSDRASPPLVFNPGGLCPAQPVRISDGASSPADEP